MPENKSKSPKTTRTWDQYVKEADHGPFVLKAGDQTIEIKSPTGAQALEGQRLSLGGGTLIDQIRVLCGDAADEVAELVLAAPAGAGNRLITDILDHFRIGVTDDEDDGVSPT